MTDAILHQHLPFTPWADPALARLPGLAPVHGPWVIRDEVCAAQLALRRRLRADHPAETYARIPGHGDAEAEAVRLVLDAAPPEARDRAPATTTRLSDLAEVVQEDLLLLTRSGAEHVLTAGLLCFPASWTLAEKLGQPLTRIHRPVDGYPVTPVQRLFDRLPAGRPLWRANALGYAEPWLYHPRPEDNPRRKAPARYLRVERQTVLRLPETGALLFAIHSYVLPPSALTEAQRASCPITFAAPDDESGT